MRKALIIFAFAMLPLALIVGAGSTPAASQKSLGKQAAIAHQKAQSKISQIVFSDVFMANQKKEKDCLDNLLRLLNISNNTSYMVIADGLFWEGYFAGAVRDRFTLMQKIRATLQQKSNRIARQATSRESTQVAASLAAHGRLLVGYKRAPRFNFCRVDVGNIKAEVDVFSRQWKNWNKNYRDEEKQILRGFKSLMNTSLDFALIDDYPEYLVNATRRPLNMPTNLPLD